MISVIVPLYYGKCYIEKIIFQLEACAQQVPEHEIQLVLSNDAPEERIENACGLSKISLKIFNTDHNEGIHKARLNGLKNSDGEYILFLDQDDAIRKDYFASQLSRLGDADAVVCGAVSGGKIKYNTDRPLEKAASRVCMVNEGNMILSPGQVLLRREAVPAVWTENKMHYKGADDWLLWLCMHAEGKKFAVNREILFIREIHYHNASSHSCEMTMSENEVVDIIEENHMLKEEERVTLKKLLPKLREKREKENEKWKRMFLLQNDWFGVYNHEKSVARFLEERAIKRVAIYGYGYLGRTLLENLEKEKIEVAYIIDKNAAYLNVNKKCCTLRNLFEPVEAVIISLLKDDCPYLKEEILEAMETNIIWLEDMVACLI